MHFRKALTINCKSTWPDICTFYTGFAYAEEPEGMQSVQYFFDMQPACAHQI